MVLDDFLLPKEFERMFNYAHAAEYQGVHEGGWHKVWRLGDGTPLRGPTSWYVPESRNSAESPTRITAYPTGSDIDIFIRAMLEVLPEAKPIVGAPGDWDSLSFAPWIYPPGTALSLHADGHRYTGAYTFYLHPHWNIHWGANLLVLQGDPDSGEAKYDVGPWFLDEAIENRTVWNPGIATCIFPKPNRLVLIAPHARHLISRVDHNAGNNPRVSVAGFFHRSGSA